MTDIHMRVAPTTLPLYTRGWELGPDTEVTFGKSALGPVSNESIFRCSHCGLTFNRNQREAKATLCGKERHGDTTNHMIATKREVKPSSSSNLVVVPRQSNRVVDKSKARQKSRTRNTNFDLYQMVNLHQADMLGTGRCDAEPTEPVPQT